MPLVKAFSLKCAPPVAALGISPTPTKEANAINTGLVMPVISALLKRAAWQILLAPQLLLAAIQQKIKPYCDLLLPSRNLLRSNIFLIDGHRVGVISHHVHVDAGSGVGVDGVASLEGLTICSTIGKRAVHSAGCRHNTRSRHSFNISSERESLARWRMG